MPEVYDQGSGRPETVSPEKLSSAEKNAAGPSPDSTPMSEPDQSGPRENQVNGGTPDPGLTKLTDMEPSTPGIIRFAKNNRGKIIIGGASATFITLIIIGFFALLPFKILHIVNNLQSRFFATSEAAVGKETNKLFSEYLRQYVLPGLKTCKAGSTIDKSCTPRAVQRNKTLVGKLFYGWRRAHLENTLATKYGLEFQYDKGSGKYFMKAPGLSARGLDFSDFGMPNNNESWDDYIRNNSRLSAVTRSQLRSEVRNALESETRYKRTLYRFKIGRLLEEKYGIKRCIVACKLRDNFADWKNNKKNAYKAYLVQRIVGPRSEMLSLVLQCILAGGAGGSDVCANPAKPTEKDITPCDKTSGSGCSLNGQAEDKWTRNLRAQLDDYSRRFGSEGVKQLLDEVKKIRESGYSGYILSKIFNGGKPPVDQLKDSKGQDLIQQNPSEIPKDKKLANTVIKQFNDALNPARGLFGVANTVARVIGELSQIGPKLQKMTYITNTSSMVAIFAMYRTYADEIKSGNVDPAIVDAFTKSLNAGSQDTQDTTLQIGGTAEAEHTPLYGSLISNPTGAPVASSLFSSTAYAASPSPSPYLCNNGSPVSSGLVCPEEKPGYNPVSQNLNQAFSQEPLATLGSIARGWNKTVGGVFSIFSQPINWVTQQVFDAVNYVAKAAGVTGGLEKAFNYILNKFSSWLVSYLVPSPFSSNMSGGRTFDMIAAGADVSGNDYAHFGLGGQVITPQQQSSIISEQQQLDLAQYSSKPFFSRIFDTSSDYSLITKLAVAMPGSLSSALDDVIASLSSNPFGKIFHSFALVFATGRAGAAPVSIGQDPFDILQYGYPQKDPYSVPTEQYWQQNCQDPSAPADSPLVNIAPGSTTSKWNTTDTKLNNNFMPANYTTNPCLLIQATVGSAGAIYDPGLLTPDDTATNDSMATSQASQSGPVSTSPTSSNPSGPTTTSPAPVPNGCTIGGVPQKKGAVAC